MSISIEYVYRGYTRASDASASARDGPTDARDSTDRDVHRGG